MHAVRPNNVKAAFFRSSDSVLVLLLHALIDYYCFRRRRRRCRRCFKMFLSMLVPYPATDVRK